jgi:hypothetical protein
VRNLAAIFSFALIGSKLFAQPVIGESKLAHVDHLKVHYTDYGKGDTALVPLHEFFDRDTIEKFVVPLKGDNYPQATGRVIDGMTKPIKDRVLRDRIKTLIFKTPQHVAVSEFEATGAEDLWKQDKIDVPVLMILAKQPA